jgi:dolichyl-phosphate beta-glucosyltransferase
MAASLSVIIPVFNEEDAIVTILKAAMLQLGEREAPWEIIVVDNGSTDRTCEFVQPFLEDPRIKLLENGENRGKGYSIRRGMLEATSDLRLMCDADCVASLASLPAMERASERYDVVCGSRVVKGAAVDLAQPPRRRLVGFGFLMLTRIALGRLARDVYCGFKLWRSDVTVAVFERVELTGWVFDAEALALAKRMGYTVTEVGIEWTDRRDSRLSIRNVLVPVVGELARARRNVRRTPR